MELKTTSASTGVQTLASVAGMVANFIVPASGGLVSAAIMKGAPILQGVLDLFNRKKGEGLADEAAAAAVAQSMADQRAYIEKLARLDIEYQKYLDQITPEDYKISTILKRAKIGGLDIQKAYAEAVATGAVNPSLLGVFRYLDQKAATFTAGAASADAAIDKPIVGQDNPPEKPTSGFYSGKRFVALALLVGALYVNYVSAPAAAKADATKRARQSAAKKARAAKKAAAAKKAPAVRKIVKKA